MKRPVTSLCRRPGKKTACGQSVPGKRTFSTHRDAPRRSSGAAGQKPPGRGRKNSPGEGRGLYAGCAPWGSGGHGGSGAGKAPHWAPAGAEGIPGAKTVSGGGWGLRPWESGGHHVRGGVWKVPHLASAGAGSISKRKNSPRRGPEAVWMRDMGVTCPGRSV